MAKRKTPRAAVGSGKIVSAKKQKAKGTKVPVKKKTASKRLKAVSRLAKEDVRESKEKKAAKQKKQESPKRNQESERLCQAVVAGMQEKKATEIVIIDLRDIKNAIADFFVVCSGGSEKQIEAIADSIDEEVFKTLHENPWHSEGKHNKEWMLLDYITVVAHVFKKERRQYYGLEKLWGDAEIIEIAD